MSGATAHATARFSPFWRRSDRAWALAVGGEETLDLDIAPGVHTVPMSARVPPDGEECGGLLQPAAGVPTGPTAVWFKTTNTDVTPRPDPLAFPGGRPVSVSPA